MSPARLAALAAGAALAGCVALAAAQQTAPGQKAAPKKLTPQQQLEQQQKAAAQKARYDTYEASRRYPTRKGGCQPDEDALGAFCVKACKKGYVEIDDRKASTRQCRSVKPLPPGVLPAADQKETSREPVRIQKSPAGKAGSGV